PLRGHRNRHRTSLSRCLVFLFVREGESFIGMTGGASPIAATSVAGVMCRMKSIILGLIVLLALAIPLRPAPALTVRVDPAHGAPRWVVNGKPVRARVFWGAPGSTPLPLTPTPREISFDFVAEGTATTGTMHFRFGQTPGEVDLDDITVTDLSDSHIVLPRCDFEGGTPSFTRE